MVFIYAFLLPAILCAFFQFMLNHTKLNLLKILATVWILGGLLGALGVMGILEQYAGGGAMATIMGAGSMVANSAIIAFEGNIGACIGMLGSFVGIMAFILILGIVAAICYMKKHPDYEKKLTIDSASGDKPDL